MHKEQGLTRAEVSRNLDISPKSLKAWVVLYESGTLKGSLGVTKLTPDRLRIRELERELAIAREEHDILKKATAYFRSELRGFCPYIFRRRPLRFCETNEVRYAMIDKLKSKHPLQMLCKQLDVSVSGYLANHSKPPPPRKQEDLRLLAYIRAAHTKGRGIYGAYKIQTELAAQVGVNRIKRLRKAAGIKCIHKRKFRVTTDSKHKLPIAPNLLNRQFEPSQPNQVWVADITYIHTDAGWLYLAAVKDLHTCEIVGWAMDERMSKQLVCDALRAAYWRKKPKPGLMHHSDRGSQYCSKAYRALQSGYKMQTLMSHKGDCWDNAPMESFFGILKTECLHHHRFKTREEAKRVTFEYIEVFYNRIRRHAKIDNQIPALFARVWQAQQIKNAA